MKIKNKKTCCLFLTFKKFANEPLYTWNKPINLRYETEISYFKFYE